SWLRAVALGEERRRRVRLRGQRELQLLPGDNLSGRRIDKVDASLRRQQALEQAQAILQARCAGKGERDGSRVTHRFIVAQGSWAQTAQAWTRLRGEFPVTGKHLVPGRKYPGQALGQIHRAMLAAGAADG